MFGGHSLQKRIIRKILINILRFNFAVNFNLGNHPLKMIINRQSAKRIIAFFIAPAALIFLISALLIVVDGLSDELHIADVAIVLGNTVQPDGLPSPRLQARLDKTIELYRQKMFSQIIVSGGTVRKALTKPR